MSVHNEPSEYAGKMVTVDLGKGPQIYVVEDYWDRVYGKSWMESDGNPASIKYAIRAVGTPIDNEVLYGKIGGLGELVHITEILPEETK